MDPSLWFFSPRTWIYRVGVEVGGASGGPRGRGRAPGGWARPPPLWTGCGSPSVDYFANIFYLFQKYFPWSFSSFRELLFLYKSNTMVILLKTASIQVSSIQIMQVRVQNKGKSVWKSRYNGDVSAYIQTVQHVLAWEGVQRHLLGDLNLEKIFDHLMDDDPNANDLASLEVTLFLFVPFTSLNTQVFTIKHLHTLIKICSYRTTTFFTERTIR